MNKRGKRKNIKKVQMLIVGIVVLILIVTLGIVMSQRKAKESNEDNDTKESTRVAIEQTVEYGDDIADQTFTVNLEDEEKEARFADLDPEIDTMVVGQTEHTLELEDVVFDVTVTVEDTQMPVLKGVKDLIELEDEEIDIEDSLNKLITAEDPVDGELEVIFEINEDDEKEGHYNVTVEATDENGHKTSETFKVVVKIVAEEEKEEKEEKADKKDVKDQSPPVASKSENDTSKPKQEKPKQEESKKEKPKQEKPKQEQPKQEEPKKEEPKKEEPKKEEPKNEESKEEEYQCSGVVAIGDGPPKFPPLNDPTGPLPDGASLTKKETSFHYYSYNRSLPGGGSITEVTMSYGHCQLSVELSATDNNGDSFRWYFDIEADQMGYRFAFEVKMPTLTDDDKSMLFDVSRAFARSYGLY